MRHAIAIDFGGTAIKGALITENGVLVSQTCVPTESEKGHAAIIANILAVIEKLRTESGDECVGVGIGVAGPTMSTKGMVVQSPNTTMESETMLAQIIQDKTGLATILHNDANAAMFGEIWQGGAKGAQSAILFTLGTGIGGGVVIGGKVFDGGFGVGAELGHIRLSKDGPACALGTVGCFEALANKDAVLTAARKTIREDIADTKEVYTLAQEGNAEALAIWKDFGYWIGSALGNYINIFNPEMCLIGGNIADAWEFFEESMMTETKACSYPELFAMTTVTKAKLGNDAGVYGMAHAVFEQSNTL